MMQLSNIAIVLLLALLIYASVKTGALFQTLRNSKAKPADLRQRLIGGVVSIVVFTVAVAVTGWR